MVDKEKLFFIKRGDHFVYGLHITRQRYIPEIILVSVADDAMRFHADEAHAFLLLMKLFRVSDLVIVPYFDVIK